ncbi:hypothetical protein THAOC_15225, partial [Thalassiosira oceanica]
RGGEDERQSTWTAKRGRRAAPRLGRHWPSLPELVDTVPHPSPPRAPPPSSDEGEETTRRESRRSPSGERRRSYGGKEPVGGKVARRAGGEEGPVL